MTNEERVCEIKNDINVTKNIEKLFIENRNFVVFVIFRTLKRKDIPEDDLEDFIQGAYFALIKAIDKYDATKGVKFLTYYNYQIMSQLLRHDVPCSYMFRKYSSYDKQLNSENGDSFTILDTIEDESSGAAFDKILDTDFQIKFWEQLNLHYQIQLCLML